jgi:hypothetical protein
MRRPTQPFPNIRIRSKYPTGTRVVLTEEHYRAKPYGGSIPEGTEGTVQEQIVGNGNKIPKACTVVNLDGYGAFWVLNSAFVSLDTSLEALA